MSKVGWEPKLRCPHCGKRILSEEAARTLRYMRENAPRRGGYMFEGARKAYDAGEKDSDIVELLEIGAIEPHEDPTKGWVIK